MDNKNKIIKYSLYLGLNDKDTKTQKIDTLEAYKILCNLLKSYNVEGFTVYNAQGFYVHDDGSFTVENTLKVELMFIKELTVDNIIKQLKIIFNQESVIKQVEEVTSEMV